MSFPGDDIPVIKGSALKALEGDPEWEKTVEELMDAVDSYIPTPARDIEKPFLMPVEDIFTIQGRGTVATGRVERGKVKVNETVEIVGIQATRKTVVTGRGDVQEAAGRRDGGRQRRVAAARSGAERHRARAGDREAGIDHAAHEVQGGGVCADEGRRRTTHAVLHGLPAAVLLSDDGRDGSGELAGGSGDGDAGRQRGDGDRVDRADRDGEGTAVRDSRRRPHGRSRHGVGSCGIGLGLSLELCRCQLNSIETRDQRQLTTDNGQ